FDCSGLTMWAWARAGKSLPHSSGGQMSATQRISADQLQPGDLVFYGSPVHHVAMYIGGGSVVHAPNSGSVVKVVPVGYSGRISGYGRVG
ncbi:MAG: C40 family peptidase, partial [Acidimicrobiales bacterium]